MNYAGKKSRIILCIIAFAMIACTLFLGVQPIVSSAAGSNMVDFDKTDVLDDLKSSKVNGKAFNIKNYPFDESKDAQILNFVEYCYSYKANLRDNYGLYIYVYNPKGINISTNTKQNKIQMAVAYDKNGNPTSYEKFSLEFCSKVESGDYKNLFYKYKVIDRKVNGNTFAERVNSNARRYDVSGIELTRYGSSNATEYPVCGTYTFTGFSKGCGPDPKAQSTLDCNIEYLETISLSVKHTYYRSETSSLGVGHQNQLDTVYFSVPQRYIDTYGKLQKIKAEWYEYKTKDIIVTSNSDFYVKAISYIGKYMGDLDDKYMYDYNEDVYYMLCQDPESGGGINAARWGWNLNGYLHNACQRLCYLFYVDDIEEYDPYANVEDVGGVQSNDLYKWIIGYDKSYAKGTLPIKDGKISADLFTDDIDDKRKMNNENGVIKQGYSYYDFDADVDLQVLESWSSTSPSFWDNWINFGLGAAFSGGPTEETVSMPPIQILKSSDLTGSDTEVAKRLLVNVNDVPSIRAEYKDATTISGTNDEDKVVVLFRFATSDYYAAPVNIIDPDGGLFWSDKHIEGEAYRAQESVFLDFDIIQLTFNKEGDYTVIPVVSNPIDIVNDITSPVNMPDDVEWWKVIVAIIMGLILLSIFAPLLPYIISFVIWLISLPFKLIGVIIKSISLSRKKKRDIEFKEWEEL